MWCAQFLAAYYALFGFAAITADGMGRSGRALNLSAALLVSWPVFNHARARTTDTLALHAWSLCPNVQLRTRTHTSLIRLHCMRGIAAGRFVERTPNVQPRAHTTLLYGMRGLPCWSLR